MANVHTLTPRGAAPAAPPVPPARAAADRIDPRRFAAFLAMTFGMFMAILDIQIVSASLSEIQAGLAAGPDEIAWVQTSYLIAEVIMIPLSGFLSRALGTRTLFTAAAAGFTIASFMCGLSTTLEEMIFWRVIQGFVGGGMIPSVFAASYSIFPRSRMGLITPLIGLVVTLAPTIGPTVGGYLTDHLSWHWLFFINIVPGIFVTIAAALLIDFDKPDYSLLDHFDWLGFFAMAGFLGGLQYALEEGPRNDWFDDETVVLFTVISAISGLIFFWRVLSTKYPIVDLRAFSNRNYAVGTLFNFILGSGLYGLTYLYPVYLARIRDYNALQIGETMFVTGLTMFLTAPLVGRLLGRVDPRYLMITGFISFGIGTWWMSNITHDWGFYELLLPQVFRGFGLMMAMIPVNNVSLGTLPPERLKDASGVFNLTRNLGGAVGLAALSTLLTHRTDFHAARMQESLTFAHRPAMEMLEGLTQRFRDFGSDAAPMALKQMHLLVQREALVMSFADIFLLFTLLFAFLAVLALMVKRPTPAAAPPPEAH
ncbi:MULTISPECIES: DHA2 family efflux MFS transporter permease subunit [Rhodomicrobium]|uniref:DHA2 family efflux MFS transporter permease subunit n=1 Tax=Rhodomicrobium TaxID=1068 RepID=UPI000B4B6BEF|nr:MULTISPECIES: DHA2 family efflux MFS transporter permease subunit [Rhodomicrobium]